MVSLILGQITALTALTTAEATIVVKAIDAGMGVVAALGIVLGGGVSGLLVGAIRKAIMKGVATKVLIAL